MKKMITIKFALLAIATSLFLTATAQAATFTVDRTDDATVSTCTAAPNDCTLRGAIAAANAAATADTIDFDPLIFNTRQTIILSGTQLSITGSATNTLTFNGPGANMLTISGNNASRVINIGAGAVVVIGGLTISDGFQSGQNGAGILSSGNGISLTLNDSVVSNNGSSTAAAAGVGIYSAGTGTSLTLNNSAVTNNKAISGSGVGIYSTTATLTLNNSTVSFNDGDTDRGGSSAASGAGITSFNGTFVMNNSTVTNNIGGNGTGLFISSTSPTTITDSTISNNFVSNATALNGGGIYINNSTGTVDLIRSTVSGNTAGGAGGGIYKSSSGDLNITASTINGNQTGTNGGGIFNANGLTTLTNSTVSGNNGNGAASKGGGIFVVTSSLTLNNSTVSNNSVSTANFGGGIYNNGPNTAVITLDNTIIANSTSGGDCAKVATGVINASYSLIEGGLTCLNTSSNNLMGDPNLGPLQNNGGATLTHRLLAGSIAIDQGNSALTTDQRGFTRPYDNPAIGNAPGGNGSDIGSFELQVSLTFTVTQTGDAGDGVCDATCTLRDAVLAANASVGDNFIGFSPAVFSTPQTITLGGTELTVANNGTLGINGTGASQLTVSGNNLSRVFSIDTGANVTINGITVTSGNGIGTNGSGDGGGFYNLGTLILNNTTVGNSSAANTGGGISNFGTNGVLTLINSTVSGNSAAANGGGIYNTNNGTVTLTNSTVSGNSTTGGNGGGIGILSGTLISTSSTVSGNFATAGNGGGISNSATATLTNSTVSGNTANAGNGGGISNSGTLTALHATLSNNSAAANLGGGIYNTNGTTTLDNTIIANSTAGGDCVRPTGTINAIFSLIEDGLGCVNGTNTSNLMGDPNLGPLQNNGGATLTHALLAGSIAIDQGNSTLTIDQRGVTRPIDDPNSANGTGNLADIGAFEVQAPTAATVSVSGRVMVAGDRGLTNALVYLTDQSGATRFARTTAFGYYRFDDVAAGQTYIVSIRSKRYYFAPQIVTITEETRDLNFAAQ